MRQDIEHKEFVEALASYDKRFKGFRDFLILAVKALCPEVSAYGGNLLLYCPEPLNSGLRTVFKYFHKGDLKLTIYENLGRFEVSVPECGQRLVDWQLRNITTKRAGLSLLKPEQAEENAWELEPAYVFCPYNAFDGEQKPEPQDYAKLRFMQGFKLYHAK